MGSAKMVRTAIETASTLRDSVHHRFLYFLNRSMNKAPTPQTKARIRSIVSILIIHAQYTSSVSESVINQLPYAERNNVIWEHIPVNRPQKSLLTWLFITPQHSKVKAKSPK